MCFITPRVKPPPDEVEGDIFDRQRCIVGFNQGAIEKQVCFVLGTGGIGQNVALTLARLGVGKIIMLDCDTCVAAVVAVAVAVTVTVAVAVAVVEWGNLFPRIGCVLRCCFVCLSDVVSSAPATTPQT